MAGRRGSRESGRLIEHLRTHGTPSLRLSGEARGRILEDRSRGRLSGAGARTRGRLPVVSLTAAAVAVLLVSAALLVKPPRSVPSRSPEVIENSTHASHMWADYRDGQVILTWKGDSSRPFAIRQGPGVPEARTAPALLVEGTTFVQPAAPAANKAVFYVVE